MLHSIKTLPPKLLIGMRNHVTLQNRNPFELWSKFMPRKREIKNTVNELLYSVQVYDTHEAPKLTTKFDQWAAVEVENSSDVPDGMESYELKGGLYAVFIHVGLPSSFPETMNHIHNEWLPNSEFEVDFREHFEVLGANYKRNDPTSEEEVWVPVRIKKR
ncbi:MAG: GyrI-like domain-containing protein [Spirosomaceae bacterium]|nr:GyrI-like domain-containing protein [Spirosomataceae bacterium]